MSSPKLTRRQQSTNGLTIRHGGRDTHIDCDASTTVKQLRQFVHEKIGLASARQRLLYFHGGADPVVLGDDNKSLKEFNISCDGRTVITVKDLGWQVDWRTVFIAEYAGPLVIHQLAVLAGGRFGRLAPVQLALWAMVSSHYLKRLFESVFVHRFSHATMPVTGMLKNCVHYWLVGGVWMCYAYYYSGDHHANVNLTAQQKAILTTFTLAELGNLYAHLKLRWLRPAGTKKRAIPTGFPFTWCSCPNYLFELIAWLSVASMMPTAVVGWVFAGAGGFQMWLWAVKKHKQYVKEFPDYPKNRSPMFPFTGF